MLNSHLCRSIVIDVVFRSAYPTINRLSWEFFVVENLTHLAATAESHLDTGGINVEGDFFAIVRHDIYQVSCGLRLFAEPME